MKVIFKTIKLEKLRFFRGVLRLYLRLMAALNERPMTEKKQYWKRDVVLSLLLDPYFLRCSMTSNGVWCMEMKQDPSFSLGKSRVYNKTTRKTYVLTKGRFKLHWSSKKTTRLGLKIG